MKIIILKDKAKVGRAGEIKEVSEGFALNFLIPQGFAEKATPEKIKQFQSREKEKGEKQKIHNSLVLKTLEDLSGKKINISRKANEKGHLYEEIHPDEIIEALKKQLKIEIRKEMLVLPHHLKEVGEFEVVVEAEGHKEKFVLSVEALK